MCRWCRTPSPWHCHSRTFLLLDISIFTKKQTLVWASTWEHIFIFIISDNKLYSAIPHYLGIYRSRMEVETLRKAEVNLKLHIFYFLKKKRNAKKLCFLKCTKCLYQCWEALSEESNWITEMRIWAQGAQRDKASKDWAVITNGRESTSPIKRL